MTEIGIVIKVNGETVKGIESNMATDVKPSVPAIEEKPEPKTFDDGGLGLRLLNRDALDDIETAKLTADVVGYIQTLLKNKDRKTAYEFLKEHKDHLDPEMKEMISDELKRDKGIL